LKVVPAPGSLCTQTLSVLLLPGVGVGTIVGWNLLRALRANRREFRRRRAPSIGTRD